MKKILSALTILAVVALGVTGALAVIPHVHSHDLNHSQHTTCPVYQASVGHLDAGLAETPAPFFIEFVFAFLVLLPFFFTSSVFSSDVRLRAPPAFSL